MTQNIHVVYVKQSMGVAVVSTFIQQGTGL